MEGHKKHERKEQTRSNRIKGRRLLERTMLLAAAASSLSSSLVFQPRTTNSLHAPFSPPPFRNQLWDDVRSTVPVVRPAADGTSALLGPSGTALAPVRLTLDDTPGGGRHYCVPCSRHFVSALALSKHGQGKPHKRRVKALQGTRPHGQRDAEAAAGVGEPDNGPRGKKGAGGGGRLSIPRGLGGVSASAAAATADELAALTGMAL